MTIFRHELRLGRIALIVWTAAIASMMALCILIFPEMASQMGTVTKLFANMGAFTAAFGMDKLNFGEFTGFFCIECGNVLGLGGAFYAALIGAAALSKEEKEHTAEFLLTHPISRTRVVAEKLIAIFAQIIIMNVIVALATALCMLVIKADASITTMALLLLAYLIMQLEVAAITFGISAYIKNNSLGIGLGLAALFYFLQIAANMSKKLDAVKYITPFSYTDGADIVSSGHLAYTHLSVGIILGVICIVLAFHQYTRKDIY